jgi:hypothetical protein
VIQGTEEPMLRTIYRSTMTTKREKKEGEWFSLYTSHVKKEGAGYGQSKRYSRQ